jgi:hypothetical protein
MDGQIIKPLSLAAMSRVLSEYLGIKASGIQDNPAE